MSRADSSHVRFPGHRCVMSRGALTSAMFQRQIRPLPSLRSGWMDSSASLLPPRNTVRCRLTHLNKASDEAAKTVLFTRKKKDGVVSDISEGLHGKGRRRPSQFERFCQWMMDLVSVWSNQSLNQKASRLREEIPLSKGREEKREEKGRRKGGEDNCGCVISNSLVPVKPAGKVILLPHSFSFPPWCT